MGNATSAAGLLVGVCWLPRLRLLASAGAEMLPGTAAAVLLCTAPGGAACLLGGWCTTPGGVAFLVGKLRGAAVAATAA